MTIESFFIAMALGQSLLILIILVGRLAVKRQLHILFLAGFFLLQSIDLFHDLAFVPPFNISHILFGWIYPVYPLFPSLLWLYVREMTRPQGHIEARIYWHLMALPVSGFMLAPLLFLPPDIRVNPSVATGGSHALGIQLAEFGIAAFLLFWSLLMIGYSWTIVRRLLTFHRTLRALFASPRSVELVWLNYVVIAILLISGLKILDAVNGAVFGIDFMSGAFEGAYAVGMTVALGVFGIRREPPLPEWAKTIVEPIGNIELRTKGQNGKYAHSALLEADCKRLFAKIDRVMREDRLWRKHSLNLYDLSVRTGISTNNVSQAINSQTGDNFYSYVNGMRIDDAKQRLRNTVEPVLVISETVGFNSKSTFNSAFKQVTGTTPSRYRDQIRRLEISA